MSKIQQAINTSRHEVTGFSPAFLNFARHIPVSGKYYGEVSSTSDIALFPGDRECYADDMSKLKDIFVEVKQRLHKSYLRNATRYNLRKRDVSFVVGDKVWRRNKVLSDAAQYFSAKLAPRFVLSIVVKKIWPIIYELANPNGSPVGR